MGRQLGYMRISTNNEEQTFNRQSDRLAECDEIYQDRMSGNKRDRPELNRMLSDLSEGDTVIILSIDRLSRSTKDLLEIVEIIKNKGASLKSINDTWLDTTDESPMGDFLLTVMGALAEMERKQIQQRIQEGVDTAKKNGTQLGRPKANSFKTEEALRMYQEEDKTVNQICKITGISRSTLYRNLKEKGIV